jgi:hypothetical protein
MRTALIGIPVFIIALFCITVMNMTADEQYGGKNRCITFVGDAES